MIEAIWKWLLSSVAHELVGRLKTVSFHLNLNRLKMQIKSKEEIILENKKMMKNIYFYQNK